MKIKNKYIVLAGILMVSFLQWGCEPERADEHAITGSPQIPDFTMTPVPDNPNRIVLTSLAGNAFQVLWDLPGATPKTSSKPSDTILYTKAGDFKITLYASSKDGRGTASVSKQISILQDAPLSCGPKVALLTGDCGPKGKCWTFTQKAGAVKVGPTYDDFSWYTSPPGALQGAQYDDRFCFTFSGLVYENRNNGSSVNPWDGYKVQIVDFGISDFTFTEGTGINGRDQIILQNDQFIGVWDSDNILDIIRLTETELVVRARLRNPAGEPAAEGWFELTFEAN
jgi:hypothetical protein